jgi:1,4-alpha-glucan branching enzyme
VGQTLSDEGIRFTILETHGLTRAEPRPKWGVYAPIYSPSGLAAFGRDPESSRQVWSSAEGYPGDYDYREFYRDIAYDLEMDYLRPYIHPDGIRLDTGIKYYRVTGKTNHKEPYDPERAENKAEVHAGDFIFNRRKQVEYLASVMDRAPLIVAPYDAELFGHWWYEGPAWVNYLVRKIASGQGSLRLVTLSEYLEEYPINQVAAPALSSWGYEGFNDVWLNGSNDWIYPHLHRAARLMEKLSGGHLRPVPLAARALAQAKRELFLAQASDWAFMINSGDMTEYATRRTKRHLSRFFRLGEQIQNNTIDESLLRGWEMQDNIFSSLL